MKRAPLRCMVFKTLGEVGFPLVTTTPASPSSKPPDAEPSVETLKSAPITALDQWMSPSTMGIQSRLPGSRPMDIYTPPELPKRGVSRLRPQSNLHRFVLYQFYVYFILQFYFTVFFFQKPEFYLYFYLFYLFCFAADPKNPFLWAVGRKLGPFSPTTFLGPYICQ